METPKIHKLERRSFVRVPIALHQPWRALTDRGVEAHVINAGRGGLALLLPHCAPSDFRMALSFRDVAFRGEPLTLPASAVWCRSAADGNYIVGVRFIHDEARTLPAVSELLYAALGRQDGKGPTTIHLNPGDLLTNHSWIT